MSGERRLSPRASVKFGPFALVWLDLWNNRYGLAFEWTRGRGRTLFSIGFKERA